MNARARAIDDSRPIRVRLSAMGERTRAMLEYHFDHDRRRVFAIAGSTEEPDAVIVDYDHPGTRAAFEAGRWRSGPTLIALAHGTPELGPAILVGKPLDPTGLEAAAARLRHPDRPVGSRPPSPERLAIVSPSSARRAGASRPAPASTPASAPASTAPPKPPGPNPGTAPRRVSAPARDGDSDTVPAPRPEVDASAFDDGADDRRRRLRVDALCGPARGLDAFEDPADPAHRYDPSRHLGGRLADVLEALRADASDVRGAMLVLPAAEVYVLPWLQRVCTSEPLNWSAGVERMFRALDDADVELVTYRPATVNALVARVNAKACQSYPIDAFVWLAALFSARGRLPFGVDVHRPVRLRHWPAFTRLEMTPGCLAIAAEWTRAPRSVAGTIERLDCEPRFVTTLFAGAAASGALTAARR